MNKIDFCTFEQSKKLKELGYQTDGWINFIYFDDGNLCEFRDATRRELVTAVSAPTTHLLNSQGNLSKNFIRKNLTPKQVTDSVNPIAGLRNGEGWS